MGFNARDSMYGLQYQGFIVRALMMGLQCQAPIFQGFNVWDSMSGLRCMGFNIRAPMSPVFNVWAPR